MRIQHTDRAVVLGFDREVAVLSSASVGGGLFRARLLVNMKTDAARVMRSTPGELVAAFLSEQGLEGPAVGMLTSADLAWAQFVLRDDRGVAVLAVVTAGTSNALNSAESTGSPYLGDGAPLPPGNAPDTGFATPLGTINIILVTNRALTQEAMVGSVIVATEAKSAALFDLQVRSVVTGSQATGTGTDTVAVVSGLEDPIRYAGGHTRYGQLLGEAVYEGVRRSLRKRSSAPLPAGRLSGLFRF